MMASMVLCAIPGPAAAADGDLWAYGNAGTGDIGQTVMQGTSPSIAGLATGGYEIAYQPPSTVLSTLGSSGTGTSGLGMLPGTSPAIAALPQGGYEVAIQANTTALWTYGSDGTKDWGLGMMRGSSPSITGLSNDGYEAAMEANTTDLWDAGSAGVANLGLGMHSRHESGHQLRRLIVRDGVRGQHRCALDLDSHPGIGHGTRHARRHQPEHRPDQRQQLGSRLPGQHDDPVDDGRGGHDQHGPGHGAGDEPQHHRARSRRLRGGLPGRNGHLWTYGSTGTADTGMAVAPGTSPSISGLSGGGFEVAFQAPPPVAVQPTPVSSPVPTPPAGRRRLRVKLSLSWTWNRAETHLKRMQVGRLPRVAQIRFVCRGAGCAHRPVVARHGHVGRLERALRGRWFRAGDRVFITVSAPRRQAERAEIVIRSGMVPAVKLL